MLIDTLSVSYSSLEELMERQQIIEQTIQDYIEEKKLADYFESTITISDTRCHLKVDIIKR